LKGGAASLTASGSGAPPPSSGGREHLVLQLCEARLYGAALLAIGGVKFLPRVFTAVNSPPSNAATAWVKSPI